MLHPSETEIKRSKYRLLGLIGQGQFGQVYCAVHRPTGRLVALKSLAHERFPTHKFLRELRFLLSLQHPNIVTCQALEHTATGRYLVMDYCEGGTLRTLMTEESRLAVPYSLKIVADVLAGLEHAHSRGIVHCDIKPENILLHVHAGGWTARISDFGIARLSREIVRQDGNTGSPAYMAPERFYGQYSVASDLYSVGILLFELLAGYRPFSGTPAQLMSAHLNTPLHLPDTIPSVWQPLITQALQKLPARRFHSASEMLAAIHAIAKPAASTESTEAWVDWSTAPTPLFFTVELPPECQFQPQEQTPLKQKITALAVAQPEDTVPAAPPANWTDGTAASWVVYQAAGHQLQQVRGRLAATSTESEQPFQPIATVSGEPIEQLLVRPQGCFVVTAQAVQLLPFSSTSEGSMSLQPIAVWPQPSRVAISSDGSWLAAIVSSVGESHLHWQRIAERPSFAVASQPVALHLPDMQSASLLPLDLRHLAIATTNPPAFASDPSRKEQAAGTTIRVFTRRGALLGSLPLAVRLETVILTANPYQLLAADADHAGALLLIDLKPYRIKRLWVEITPAFLAVTDWGYIVAEAAGRIVFLDQEGRQIGTIHSPAAITAIATMQGDRLLIATWDHDHGALYRFELRDLGLDLVF
ncbi:MAG: serine/threonine-protein kinase [Leptolyngbya sp. IPPAS B-1204]